MRQFINNIILGLILISVLVVVHESIHYSIDQDYGCENMTFHANLNGFFVSTPGQECMTLPNWNLAQSLNEIMLLPSIMLLLIIYIMMAEKKE